MKQQLLLALVLAPLATASADVLNVGGPNPDFNQINPAIATASDGDVIRVWPGNYDTFQIHGMALTVVRGDTSGLVVIQGTVRVQSLAASQEVVLEGIQATGTDGEGLILYGNDGAVKLRDCVFQGAAADQDVWSSNSHDGMTGVRAEYCANIAFTSCVVEGGNTSDVWDSWNQYSMDGGVGLVGTDASISSFDSEFTGGHGSSVYDVASYDGGDGGHGALVSGSFLYASGCTFTGGHGGSGGDAGWSGYPGNGGNGGDGIQAWQGSDLHLLDSVYLPGLKGYGGYSGGWYQGSDGSDGQEVSLFNSTREDLVGNARHLDVPTLLPEQTTVDIVVEGQPGDLVLLVASERSKLRYIAPAHGPLLLRSPFDMPRQILGYLPGSGSQTYQFTVPDVPPLAAITWHFQAGLIPSSGGLYLSSVRSGVLLDSAW
ncbi:hypothetical protein CMO84_07890 [Candidatus Woesearchaeota archaeon]|nr:hypothetical protein [Candidatus Woesearchaeota archaeon]